MKLHHTYQTQLHQSVNISDLFRRATIHDHAQLLESNQVMIHPTWHSFNITKGPASFAQTRLYLDERVRFSSAANAVATYHIPLVYEIVEMPLSLNRLKRALHAIIHKHKTLRTRLVYDENEGVLQQEILPSIPLEIHLTSVDNGKAL
ncbi:unnamed protein product, partial [Adineta ricciae]